MDESAATIRVVAGDGFEDEDPAPEGIAFLEATADKVVALRLWYRVGKPIGRDQFITAVQERLGRGLQDVGPTEVEEATRLEASDLLTRALTHEVTDPVRRAKWISQARNTGAVREAEDAVQATWVRLVHGSRAGTLSVRHFRDGTVPTLQVMFKKDDAENALDPRFNLVLNSICDGIKRSQATVEEGKFGDEATTILRPPLPLHVLGEEVVARCTQRTVLGGKDPVPDTVDLLMTGDAAAQAYRSLVTVIQSAHIDGPLISPDLSQARPNEAKRDFAYASMAANRFLSEWYGEELYLTGLRQDMKQVLSRAMKETVPAYESERALSRARPNVGWILYQAPEMLPPVAPEAFADAADDLDWEANTGWADAAFMVLYQVIARCVTLGYMPAFLLAPPRDVSAPRRFARGTWLRRLALEVSDWRHEALRRVGRADLIRDFADAAGSGDSPFLRDIAGAARETIDDLTQSINRQLQHSVGEPSPAIETAIDAARSAIETLSQLLAKEGLAQGQYG
jgi:hypothetical protein